jgi:hypothetical protein
VLYASFKEYVLVLQKEPKVEVFTRQDDKTWLYQIATGLEANIHYTVHHQLCNTTA